MKTLFRSSQYFSNRFGSLFTFCKLTLAILLLAYPAAGSDVVFGFANAMGASNTNLGNSVAVDASGNVYTTGSFEGTADFDSGGGITNLMSGGGEDIFVQKLDSSGNFVWARSMGGTGTGDRGEGIAVDGSGNVYTTGYFDGTGDFDPGAGTNILATAGSLDIFVQKLDSVGNFVWAKAIGGTGADFGIGIDVDGSGDVHVTGSFSGVVDFDPGAGTTNLTGGGGFDDIFVLKLDSAGNFIWAKAMGGTNNERGWGISVDASGNVHIAGGFEGIADFDPGPGTAYRVSAGNDDIFVSKLDSAGNFVWVKTVGGTNGDRSRGIRVDGAGNVYTIGNFSGTVDFDPGFGTAFFQDGFFVQKLDSAGNFVWAKAIHGSSFESAFGVSVDASGNPYIAGGFWGTVDFDPGAGTADLISVGDTDIFVLKLDSAGNFVWVKAMGGTDDELAHSIAVDGAGNVISTGRFGGTADFDPGPGMANRFSPSGSSIFVSKLVETGIEAPVVSAILRAGFELTNAPSVDFTVNFSKLVSGVDLSDFTIDAHSLTGVSITNVTGNGDTYTVTVSTGTGEGTLSIDFIDDDTVIDPGGIPIGGIGAGNGNFTAGEAYLFLPNLRIDGIVFLSFLAACFVLSGWAARNRRTAGGKIQ